MLLQWPTPRSLAACAVVVRNRYVAVLEIEGLVGTQPGIRHEQDEVIDLFGIPFVMAACGLLRIGTRRFIKLLVFLGTESGPMRDLALGFVRGR